MGRQKKMREKYLQLPERWRMGKNPLWARWRDNKSKRACAQEIFLMRDERYHSPCRVGTEAHWTFIASAKHNGMCECLTGEATPLTPHCGGRAAKTLLKWQTNCSVHVKQAHRGFSTKKCDILLTSTITSSVLPSQKTADKSS